MKEEPKISIIVPIYNVEKYLNRCISSLVQQTYNNLEIILVDDGSPDNSAEICEEWKKKDSRIIVFHKKNGGLSDARNYGIECSHGDYIAFVDSDDYVDLNMYQTMLASMLKNECKLACCGRYYKTKNQEIQSRCLNNETVFTDSEAIHQLLTNGCIEEAVWDKLYSASLWKDLRFPKGEINEDIVVIPEILRRSERIVHVGLPLYYYCYNGSSITKSGYSKKKDVMIDHLQALEKYIHKYYPSDEKSVNLIKARYSLTTLFSIIQSDDESKYKESYLRYLMMLRNSLPQMMTSQNFSKKQKIEACLMITRLYKVIWRMVHKN